MAVHVPDPSGSLWLLSPTGSSLDDGSPVASPITSSPRSRHFEFRPKETAALESLQNSTKKRRGRGDSESNTDPEPDLEEGYPAAVYSELFTTLIEESCNALRAGNYSKAEEAQRKAIGCLQDREARLKIPFATKSQMHEDLADINMKMKEYDKAKDILSPLLRDEPGDTPRKSRLCYNLATIYLAQGHLTGAERFAKRAYIAREKTLGKGHALISQSADLLIRIYETQGEMQTAQAFRNLYPNEQIVVQAPQISKHIGTKRVPWNPDLSVNMNAWNRSGKTLLINAISSGDDAVVQQLLQAGANVETECSGGITPLMYTVIHGQLKIAGVLLSRGAQVDTTTSGWTALRKATDLGDWKMVQLLLENGAEIEARSPKKFTPNNRSTATTGESQATIHPDSSVDFDDDYGWTPLLRAADLGDEIMVRLLLDHGANIEARNPSAATALSCAAENQHLAVMDILLCRGADPNAEDDFGWRPLHRTHAHRGGDNGPALRLLNAGVDINARCTKGKTVLHYSVERNNEPMVRLLLHAGSDIEAQDIAKRTPLYTAIECRLENMVHLLLEVGADVTVRDDEGHDALAAANHTLRKSPEVLKLLTRHVKELKRRGEMASSWPGPGGGEKARRKGSLVSRMSGSVGEGTGTSHAGVGGWWSRRGKGGK